MKNNTEANPNFPKKHSKFPYPKQNKAIRVLKKVKFAANGTTELSTQNTIRGPNSDSCDDKIYGAMRSFSN